MKFVNNGTLLAGALSAVFIVLSIPVHHLIGTAKHFVGYGTPAAGINIAPAEVGPRDFRSLHLYPFENAVKEANVYFIMPANRLC